MNRTHEDKLLGAIETKEDVPVDASCPDKPMHRLKLGQTCATCGTLIPALSAFTPDEYTHFFAPPAAESPPSPYGPDAENARMWREYEVARAALEDATFAVDDLRRALADRRPLRRRGRQRTGR